ncbi:MAG: BMP family ABC transporter substrate-binding protein [Deltaproteobacteria bacterium]|nr:BMP family ABC transporter substrate-binding protein [Deltaproteobacteria bacterium]
MIKPFVHSSFRSSFLSSFRFFCLSVVGAAALAVVAPAPAVAADKLTVGFIYVGPKTDYGYNQAHAQGAAAIAKMPGVKIREEEMVAETVAVQKTMESMINLDGAKLIFPTSFGYFDPHILKMSQKYKDATFLHCGGLYTEGKHPTNVGSYFGYIDEAQYVAGIVAGLTSKSSKLGFIAAKPIPQVLRNINSYTLGARSVNPKATTTVIFTGDWSMPVKEAEAANSLIDQGVDVLTSHVDSPKTIVELAERRGAFVTGYHANQATLAPKGYLTGAEWNWSKVYTDYVKWVQAGKTYPHLLRGGLKDGFVKVSPYGKAVSADAKKKADAAKAKFMAGTMVIYKGPIKDNAGKVVIAAGAEQKQTDIALESMDYLVEGVVGKTR